MSHLKGWSCPSNRSLLILRLRRGCGSLGQRQRALRETQQLTVPLIAFPRFFGERTDFLCQPKNLIRELEQLLVLAVLFTRQLEQFLVLAILLLHGPPLLIGYHLALRFRTVLADHHEGREEDRLERHDHRQEAERILLDAEADPA
jgi:hypothetical protein